MLIRRAEICEGRLTSKECVSPVTVGWLNPTILLPNQWGLWPQAQLDAVLAHENEHARLRDPLVQWLALLNRAVFWFHPLAWWLERRLSSLAEEACDAAVIAGGQNPLQYSEYLLAMARVVQQSGVRLNIAGMAMPGSSLPQRIRRILAGHPTQRISRLRVLSLAMTCGAISIVFTGGTVDLAQARPKVQADTNEKLKSSPAPLHQRTTTLIAQAQARTAPQRLNPTSQQIGSVTGTVEDPSGARVPVGCTISARDQNGAVVEVTATDSIGTYRFLSLPPGHYILAYAAAGFALLTVQTEIEAGKSVRIDAKLDLGQGNERVTVTGHKPSISTSSAAIAPPAPRPIKVGGNVRPMQLLRQVKPQYPPELEQQGIESTVFIRTLISRDGEPIGPRVINAEIDPRFAQAALDSVRQWRYQPTLLNGEPVETATTVAVEFRLAN